MFIYSWVLCSAVLLVSFHIVTLLVYSSIKICADIRQVPLLLFFFSVFFRVYLLSHIDLMIILSVPQNINEKPCWDSNWNCTKFILIFWGYYNTESPNPRTCYTIPFAQMVFYVHHQYFITLFFSISSLLLLLPWIGNYFFQKIFTQF